MDKNVFDIIRENSPNDNPSVLVKNKIEGVLRDELSHPLTKDVMARIKARVHDVLNRSIMERDLATYHVSTTEDRLAVVFRRNNTLSMRELEWKIRR